VRAVWTLVVCSTLVWAKGPARDYTSIVHIRRANAVIWHDPGDVARLDLRFGAGGRALAPRPPFTFVKEDTSGTSPKVQVKDAAGRSWAVKFGAEARPDTFGSRLAWALGYFAEINYFVPEGFIRGGHDLKRARHSIDESGHFSGARFQLRTKEPEYIAGVSWSWDDNPFAGTPQLNGLKILMMLLSNWDDKDIRESGSHGSNNAIFKQGSRYLFFIDDWGASMGHWGSRWVGYLKRSKWDASAFYNESAKFVRVKDGAIDWGYRGTKSDRMRDGIRVSDIRWLLQYLGRLSDAQIREGLLASGATRDEAYFYTMALRKRIGGLEQVVRGRTMVAGAK
jgi:hypothetical protein